MNLLIEHWPLALVAALVALALLYFLFRPRQRVKLTDSAPVRPHMTATTADVQTPPGPSHAASVLEVRSAGSPDDLVKLKGIGPKLAALLNERGITRFDQMASLTKAQVDDLDQQLGAFRGRLARDHVVNQAAYLARGDVDGFEQRFGKL